MTMISLDKIGRRCRACGIDPGTNRICKRCKQPIHRKCQKSHVASGGCK